LLTVGPAPRPALGDLRADILQEVPVRDSRLLVVVFVVVVAAGCGDEPQGRGSAEPDVALDSAGEADADDTGPDGADATLDTGQDTAEPDVPAEPTACSLGEPDCYRAVPEGWTGPLVLAEAETDDVPPACPPEFPELAVTAFEGYSVTPPTCECGPCSGDEQSLQCQAATATVESCAANGASWALGVGQCRGMGGDHQIQTRLSNISILGDCGTAEVVNQSEGPPGAGARVACAPAEPCDPLDDACNFPDKPAGPWQVCITKSFEGDFFGDNCPADYPQRVETYSGLEDHRACECSCSAECGLVATTHHGQGDTACDGGAAARITGSTCVETGFVNHLSLTAAGPGTCTATSRVRGHVEATRFELFCCL
jgi:hypothetical protein